MIIEEARELVDALDERLVALLADRATAIEVIAGLKGGDPVYDAAREEEILSAVRARCSGTPLPPDDAVHVFRAILEASKTAMERKPEPLVCSRSRKPFLDVGLNELFYKGHTEIIAGPCAIEDEETIHEAADQLSALGVRVLRGGAFKPRTTPYSFQGLGIDGLKMLYSAARDSGMATCSEVLDPRHLDAALDYVDIVQIGARNMANFELLKEVGQAEVPVLLKRGFAATVDELIGAAEYLAVNGAGDVIVCERGIRTFSNASRFTLDLAAVHAIREKTGLAVVVDVSHAAGRKDLVPPLFMAALGVEPDGIMVEVHPHPERARCDAGQQLTPEEFGDLLDLAVERGGLRYP